MRYQNKCLETTYDELLLTAKEAECEWLEHSTTKMKQTTVGEDTGSKEREEIRVQLDKLAETVKAASFQKRPSPKKKQSPRTPTGTHVNSPQNSPRNPGKGPAVTAVGPFRGERKLLQCYKCGGWGHVIRECPTQENLDWRELSRAGSPPVKEQTGPESTSSNKQ